MFKIIFLVFLTTISTLYQLSTASMSEDFSQIIADFQGHNPAILDEDKNKLKLWLQASIFIEENKPEEEFNSERITSINQQIQELERNNINNTTIRQIAMIKALENSLGYDHKKFLKILATGATKNFLEEKSLLKNLSKILQEEKQPPVAIEKASTTGESRRGTISSNVDQEPDQKEHQIEVLKSFFVDFEEEASTKTPIAREKINFLGVVEHEGNADEWMYELEEKKKTEKKTGQQPILKDAERKILISQNAEDIELGKLAENVREWLLDIQNIGIQQKIFSKATLLESTLALKFQDGLAQGPVFLKYAGISAARAYFKKHGNDNWNKQINKFIKPPTDKGKEKPSLEVSLFGESDPDALLQKIQSTTKEDPSFDLSEFQRLYKQQINLKVAIKDLAFLDSLTEKTKSDYVNSDEQKKISLASNLVEKKNTILINISKAIENINNRLLNSTTQTNPGVNLNSRLKKILDEDFNNTKSDLSSAIKKASPEDDDIAKEMLLKRRGAGGLGGGTIKATVSTVNEKPSFWTWASTRANMNKRAKEIEMATKYSLISSEDLQKVKARLTPAAQSDPEESINSISPSSEPRKNLTLPSPPADVSGKFNFPPGALKAKSETDSENLERDDLTLQSVADILSPATATRRSSVNNASDTDSENFEKGLTLNSVGTVSVMSPAAKRILNPGQLSPEALATNEQKSPKRYQRLFFDERRSSGSNSSPKTEINDDIVLNSFSFIKSPSAGSHKSDGSNNSQQSKTPPPPKNPLSSLRQEAKLQSRRSSDGSSDSRRSR